MVRDKIARAEQRGSLGDTASLRSGKRYFTEDTYAEGASFRACESYLRKLGRNNGDLSQRRYSYIGKGDGVCIFKSYNLHGSACETNLHQRLIWQENRDKFVSAKTSYRRFAQNCVS